MALNGKRDSLTETPVTGLKNTGVFPDDATAQALMQMQPVRTGMRTGGSKHAPRAYQYRILAVSLLEAEASPPHNSNLDILTIVPQSVD